MRPIKFRAWNERASRMMLAEQLYGMSLEALMKASMEKARELIPLQFTGLLDKNGKEIYEGDLVKWDGNTDETYEILWNGTDARYQAWRKLGFINLDVFKVTTLEVIGNIYENPELLKSA